MLKKLKHKIKRLFIGKKIKRLLGRSIRSITNEVVDAKVEKILAAGTHKGKDLGLAVSELDVFGGLMGRKEFVSKLKHVIKLVELRKEWIEESIYNRKGFPTIEILINLEKQAKAEYEKAKRERDKKDIFFGEGVLKAFEVIKEALKK